MKAEILYYTYLKGNIFNNTTVDYNSSILNYRRKKNMQKPNILDTFFFLSISTPEIGRIYWHVCKVDYMFKI